MRPQDDIDYTTLAWVKGELDETLNQARQALEAYVEDPTDVSQMRFCATYLHQVQGTLRMVELYGAAMVTEEMEHLAAALLDGGITGDRDEAYAVLMRGIVQLPDYLERLQTGHKDIPIVLLPLLNDLRAARGEKGLSEIALFTPNLGYDLPGAAQGPAEPLPEEEMRSRAEQLRAAFQIALLKWFRNEDVDTNLTRLTETCDKLVGLTAEIEARRLFWVTAGVLEALRAKSFEPSPQLKQTVGKVEREIKRLADAGEKSFRTDPPRELTRNLLYFVAHAPTQHGRIGELRNVFNLEALLPSAEEVEHARSSLTGHNRALLNTVSGAIKEDILRVKDALDLHLRNPGGDVGDLGSQIEVLERVSDTLGMLGLGEARRIVQVQRDAVQQLVSGSQTADETTLLDIAGALLYVEASLDEQVQHLGAMPLAARTAEGTSALPSIETRRVMQALVKEAQANFAQAKDGFIGFIESGWDADQLKSTPALLDQVAGALRIVELPEPAGYLDAVARFTERELLENRRVPSVEQMETLADALASLEYFLEAQGEQRPGRDRILLTARGSLEKLGYWPVPSITHAAAQAASDAAAELIPEAQQAVVDAVPVAEPFADLPIDITAAFVQSNDVPAAEAAVEAVAETLAPAPETAPTAEADTPVEAVPAVETSTAVEARPAIEETSPVADVAEPEPQAAEVAPVAAEAAGPIVGGFEATSEEIDEEIREVFVEEVAEEIDNLTELLPAWVENPSQLEQLKSIRRVFHTLKGSGRLVGALALGEFSWKVENMLNRVLDHTIQPTPAVITLVQGAHEVLPEILAALRGERSVRTDLENIKDVADRLSQGEQVHYVPAFLAAPEPAPAQQDVAQDAAEESIQDANLAASLQDEAPAEAVTDAIVNSALETSFEASVEPELSASDAAFAAAFASDNVPELSEQEIEAAILGKDEADASLIETPAESAAQDDGRIAVPAIDPVLFDILKPEVSGHLDTVEAYLAHGPQPVADSLIRAVHTMNGAFAMTEVPLVTEVTAPLENYLKRVLAQSAAPTVAGFDVLKDAAKALRDVLQELDSPEPRLTPLSDLAARICAERDLLPEAIGPFVPMPLDDDELSIDEAATASFQSEDVALAAADETSFTLAETSEESSAEEISFEGISLEEVSLEEIPAADMPEASETTEAVVADAPDVEEVDFADLSLESLNLESLELEQTQAQATEEPAADSAEEAVTFDHLVIDEALPEVEAPVEWLDASAEESSDSEDVPLLDVVEHELSDDMTSMLDEAAADDSSTVQSSADDGTAASTATMLDVSATSGDDTYSTLSPGMNDFIRSLLSGEVEITAPSADAGFEAQGASQPEESAEAAEPQAEGSEADAVEAIAETSSEADSQPQDEPARTDEAELAAAVEFFDTAPETEAIAEADPSLPEEPATEAPAVEGQAIEEQAIEEPAVEEPAVEEQAVEEQAVEEQAIAEPVAAAAVATAPAAAAGEDPRIAAWFLEGLDSADPDPDGPLSLPDMDEELLGIFAEEATDILDHADSYMVQLRESPGNQDVVVALQRDLHTLKGGARMAGLYAIGDLGHAMESLLEIVAAGERSLPGYGVDVLELAFDRINRMTSRVAAGQAVAAPNLLIQRLDMLARGDVPVLEAPVAEAAAETAPAAPTETAAVSPVQTAAVAPSRPAAPAAAPAADAGDASLSLLDDITARAPQEQIRIRADLLDRLVNYAGEVAIYRARLEQQLGLFRGNLAELEQTNERLRGQLRKLEIETEAQIVARYQREAEIGGEQAFDPLELDRFSSLQQITRALSESAADLVSLQGALEEHTRQYETLLLQQSRVSSDLQEGLMRTRMVPFDALVPRLRRIIRQTATELDKKAQLKVEGAQGEMDRSVLDRMTAPLEHMIRNSLAHGLESPRERAAAGKPKEGTITISVSREGSEVVIKVADDGRGLNRDAIRRKAIERGLLAADAQVSDRELYGFILASGFSTATTVSKVAGRGVGMDVVHSEVRQLGGSISIDSVPGKGSVFTIRLPFTLAVTQAVFVQQGETSYAVPIASVQGVARIERAELDAQLASGNPTYVYAGESYQIHDLGRLLGHAPVRAEESLQVPMLLARSGDLRVAICVDHVIGSREIVVKPVGAQVSSIPGIFGATIMGDGRVIVILDVAPLARRYAAQFLQQEEGTAEGMADVVVAAPEPVRHVPLVMVVDDSITMRKVTGRVLERHGYEVLTAKDGVDAIEKLTDRVPDVMLLDIEMPRMDGYELATHIRNDVRLRGIPIIMITSRTGEKHRQRAFEIGVDRYLGKPYQEADLMRNVEEILKVQRGDLG